jgi:hypothetical protein
MDFEPISPKKFSMQKIVGAVDRPRSLNCPRRGTQATSAGAHHRYDARLLDFTAVMPEAGDVVRIKAGAHEVSLSLLFQTSSNIDYKHGRLRMSSRNRSVSRDLKRPKSKNVGDSLLHSGIEKCLAPELNSINRATNPFGRRLFLISVKLCPRFFRTPRPLGKKPTER